MSTFLCSFLFEFNQRMKEEIVVRERISGFQREYEEEDKRKKIKGRFLLTFSLSFDKSDERERERERERKSIV